MNKNYYNMLPSQGILMFSVSEGEEAGDSSLDPEVLHLVGWQFDPHHEVGGMAGRREGSGSAQHLVNGASVDTIGGRSALNFRDKLHHRHVNEQLLGSGLSEHMGVVVPLASFEVKTVAETSILRLLLDVFPGNVIGVLETV
jgi:hypothetical protein